MRPVKPILVTVLALCLFGATAGLALADVQGGDPFRVVGLNGSQTLQLLNGPAAWSGVETELPFDARDLRATGVREGNFLQVSYRALNSGEITGWADVRFLASDQDHQPTAYRVIAARGASVPLLDASSYGVRAYIPASTAVLPACGPCQNGYCQVRYQTNRGSIEGFVAQGYLSIPRPAYTGLSAVAEPPVPNPDYAYADPLPPVSYADPSQDYVEIPLPPARVDLDWRRRQHHEHHFGY